MAYRRVDDETPHEGANGLRASLVLAVLVLAPTGCSLGIGPDRVEEFPMNLEVSIRIADPARSELIDDRWTSATELRLGAADAETLGVSERILLDAQEAAPSIWTSMETDWLVNDVGTSREFCLESAVVLVDETQGSQHTVAEASECFDSHMSFKFSADIHPGE